VPLFAIVVLTLEVQGTARDILKYPVILLAVVKPMTPTRIIWMTSGVLL
jgi:hypothetical protein